MRRTAAGTAATIFAALSIGGPLAGAASAASETLRCAVASPPAACAHLDELAAQLEPIATVLGTDLAPLVEPAQGFAARSDSSTGVPTAEVIGVSSDLLAALGDLPDRVETLLGPAVLGDLSDTLQSLIAELTKPAADDQQATGTTEPTPAKTAPAPSAPIASRSSNTSSFGATGSTSGSGSAPSSATVPDVPVGDPLRLAPLGMPEFAFSPASEPAEVVDLGPSPEEAAEVAMAQAAAALATDDRGAELGVVVVLSLLLIAGAGVAHLQAQRHTIPDA